MADIASALLESALHLNARLQSCAVYISCCRNGTHDTVFLLQRTSSIWRAPHPISAGLTGDPAAQSSCSLQIVLEDEDSLQKCRPPHLRAWNANSADTGGLVQDDWATVIFEKVGDPAEELSFGVLLCLLT